MGFFKEFKDDLSEAVDDMIPAGEVADKTDDDMINTISDGVDVEGELSKLDGLLEKAVKKVEDDKSNEDRVDTMSDSTALEENVAKGFGQLAEPAIKRPEPISAQPAIPASDENAIITSGMTISGDLDSTGSIEIQGRINGNIRCNGKLLVTGMVNGNSSASEVIIDAARIDGEINAGGTVKVGSGSVVIGNISATSAVIAGAVKGDIDVQGPVVVDTSAVVMGNVKSRSVQINNGAVIEGFCSQAYSEVDVSTVFAN